MARLIVARFFQNLHSQMSSVRRRPSPLSNDPMHAVPPVPWPRLLRPQTLVSIMQRLIYTSENLTWNLNNHQIEIIIQTYIFRVPCKFSRAYVAMHNYLFKGRFWIVVSVYLVFVGVVMDLWMLSWNPMILAPIAGWRFSGFDVHWKGRRKNCHWTRQMEHTVQKLHFTFWLQPPFVGYPSATGEGKHKYYGPNSLCQSLGFFETCENPWLKLRKVINRWCTKMHFDLLEL